MTPDHALSLSFSGIKLLERAALSGGPAQGWYALGDVALDVEDLAGALAVLREEAVASPEMQGPEVKLVLPDEQIKYLAVPRDGRDAMAQAEAELRDATPYAVDELVFDWHETGDGMLHVAAVARETLDEAETFARDHGFVPIAFVAVSSELDFGREPFFGATRTAMTELAPGVEVHPDDVQVAVVPGAPPPRGPIAVESAEAPPQDAPAEEASASRPPDTAEPKPDSPDAASETDPKATQDSEPPAPSPPAKPAPPAVDAEKPDAPGGATAVDDNAPLELPAADRSPAPGPGPGSVPGPAPDKDTPPAAPKLSATDGAEGAPVAFASLRARRDAAGDGAAAAPDPRAEGKAPKLAAPKDDTLQGAAPPAPAASTGTSGKPSAMGATTKAGIPKAPPAEAGTPPQPMTFAEAIKARAQESLGQEETENRPRGGAAASAPLGGAPGAAPPPDNARSVGNVLARAHSGLGRGIGFMSRRNRTAATSPAPAAPPQSPPRKPAPGGAAGALAAENKMDEAERMTVFGARRNAQAQVGGKPRFLGLVLTAALLLFLLAVAAWASVFVDDGIARFFGDREENAPVETALSQPQPIEETAAPEAEDAAPPALALPGDGATAPDASGDPLRDTGPQVGALSTGLPATATPPPASNGLARPLGADALSPEEAEARYAATGIWQRSPVPPAEVRQRVLGDVVIAALDSGLYTPDASRLATPDAFATDRSPPTQALPPRADERFDFDARGFIRPAPEGVVTPQGYTLVRGRPDLVPPVRGGLARPEVPEAEADTTAEAAPDTPPETAAPPPVADPALAGFRPRLRPEGIAPDPTPDPAPESAQQEAAPQAGSEDEASAQRLAPADETAAPPPQTADNPEAGAASAAASTAFAALRPAVRPPEITERATPEAEDSAAQTPLPPPASRLAVVQSLVPEDRPRNIAAIVRRTERAQERAAQQQQAAPTRVASIAPRTVTPPAPSRQSVARAATQNNVINLRRMNLIGVYGKPSDRRALVRLSNGRFQKVKVGDRLDGGRVLAISDDQLRYQKSGRNMTLDLPQS